ncbi:uncharacterized protein TNCV_3066271 [Trichonephila clavipes]|uniref:Uncharacterized protein n=1 Tax=Trichonephila clavipes TaxID=2585209 RepID=A0A8X6RWJ0_TRICX|nr:uncharacterized protein TNCV_3066271 [Trichonephila clavipes]
MYYPGFEPSPYCTAVSVAKHYIGWATLDMPYSTMRKILRRICHFYPNKVKTVHQLKDGAQWFVNLLHFSSLLNWWLTSLDQRTFYGVMKSCFAWMTKLTPTIVEFGQRKILTLSRKKTHAS